MGRWQRCCGDLPGQLTAPSTALTFVMTDPPIAMTAKERRKPVPKPSDPGQGHQFEGDRGERHGRRVRGTGDQERQGVQHAARSMSLTRLSGGKGNAQQRRPKRPGHSRTIRSIQALVLRLAHTAPPDLLDHPVTTNQPICRCLAHPGPWHGHRLAPLSTY
ncbi:hypothetical protein NGB36_00175 [Streptomyces sp. RB6PN25]|uniref:Transposase n=1 Tax=Streptomyces humicola TaxID=2953240 RepID=A0ABT1PN33_9ACTN|nr:hypothetical protein [Streptomyces humicola]MCQ4079078.1 hypothetical protein [Streptomyces humicola]